MRRCVLVVLAALLASAEAVGFGTAPVVEAPPGGYATLPFRLQASGSVDVTIDVPAGWVALSSSRSLVIDGQRTLPLTVRVPSDAVAGTEARVSVRATGSGGAAVQEGRVRVLATRGIELQSAERIDVRNGRNLVRTEILVINRGNAPERVVLALLERTGQVARIVPSELELAPFSTAAATLELDPSTGNSRYILRVEARVADDPEVQDRARVDVQVGQEQAREEAENPELVLGIRGTVGGSLRTRGGEVDVDLDYSIQPRLSGALSDYVTLEATPESFRGDLGDPFQIGDELRLSLAGQGWDAYGDIGDGRYGAGVGFEAANWRWTVGGDYRSSGGSGGGLSFSASSLDDDLDLQAYGRANLSTAGHSENLSAFYRRPLGGGVTLEAGAGVTGFTLAEEGEAFGAYILVPNLQQGLTWFGQDFDVRQNYTGIPTLGRHRLTLSGGQRTRSPFGVRGAASLSFTGESSRFGSLIRFASQPLPLLDAQVDAVFSSSDFGRSGTYVELRPQVRYAFALADGVGATTTARYRRVFPLTADERAGDFVSVDFGVRYAALRAGVAGSYERVSAGSAADASRELGFSVEAEYAFSLRATVAAEASWDRDLLPAGDSTLDLAASWNHAWSSTVTSGVGYDRRQSFGADGALGESVSVDVSIAGLVAGEGDLELGYGLEADGGFFGASEFEHRFSLGVSYGTDIPFTTPDPLVDVFGGRVSGVLEGVAFLDENFDGRRDSGEPPVAGLTVEAGGRAAVTDSEGRYSLRVPPGAYQVSFPEGLPGPLGLVEDARPEVGADVRVSLDLPLVRIASLQVDVYLDTDRDGTRDENEEALQSGAVLVEGPVNRRRSVGRTGSVFVSGLIEGRYTVRIDPDSIGRSLDTTTGPLDIEVEASRERRLLEIGVAPRVRTVVTTFQSGSLTVAGTLTPARRPAGGDLEVTARAQGEPDRVAVLLDGHRFDLDPVGDGRTGEWGGTLRLPGDTPPGFLQGEIVAERGGDEARSRVQLFVTDEPLVRASELRGERGSVLDFKVTTLFAAQTIALRMPQEEIPLASDDGYDWRADVTLASAGEAILLIDGAESQRLPVTATATDVASVEDDGEGER